MQNEKRKMETRRRGEERSERRERKKLMAYCLLCFGYKVCTVCTTINVYNLYRLRVMHHIREHSKQTNKTLSLSLFSWNNNKRRIDAAWQRQRRATSNGDHTIIIMCVCARVRRHPAKSQPQPAAHFPWWYRADWTTVTMCVRALPKVNCHRKKATRIALISRRTSIVFSIKYENSVLTTIAVYEIACRNGVAFAPRSKRNWIECCDEANRKE